MTVLLLTNRYDPTHYLVNFRLFGYEKLGKIVNFRQ